MKVLITKEITIKILEIPSVSISKNAILKPA